MYVNPTIPRIHIHTRNTHTHTHTSLEHVNLDNAKNIADVELLQSLLELLVVLPRVLADHLDLAAHGSLATGAALMIGWRERRGSGVCCELQVIYTGLA
jgi:hypothetical protein